MKYYKHTPSFGGVFSRDNVPSLRENFYVVNLDDKSGAGTHWVVIFNIGLPCIYFDSFGVQPPEEVIGRMRKTNKHMIMNTYRIQDLNSINCGFFCIYVIDKLLRGRQFIDILTNFDALNFKANDNLIACI